MENKKSIRREPIILDKNTMAVIHIFHKYDDIEDIWMQDIYKYVDEEYEQYQKSAEQFVAQLKDHWTVSFMKNLIKESFKAMTKDNDPAFNKETAEKLINQLKEINNNRN